MSLSLRNQGDTSTTQPVACAYRYTGKERDTESGLDYFGARYYTSSMGRWLSPDWADKPEAVPYSSLDNPQSLNLYEYVGNNPLSKADKDGHCYPICTVAIGAAVGFFAGAGAEYVGEKIKGEPVDSSKILHAGEGGALAGVITGLAGPEAGLAVKVGTSVGGQIIGGGVERGLNGEKILDPKQMAKDAAAGVLGTGVEGSAEKTFASTTIKKVVPPIIEAVVDSGRRAISDPSPTPDPAPPTPPLKAGQQQSQQQQPQQRDRNQW